MFRKLILLLCAIALTLASCGRQVTPDRINSGGLSSGFMQIKFNTYQPMDFTNVWYVIALNTSGDGRQPYPLNGNQQQNWLGYSFELIVFAAPGQSSPQVQLWEFLTQQGLNGIPIKVPAGPLVYNPNQLYLTYNSSTQTQFTITIDRHLFSGIAGATPSPSASPTTSPSPSPTPSGVPTSSPTPPAVGGTWNINWFTVTPGGQQGGGSVIDAPGPQGVNDLTWMPPNGTYDTTTQFDDLWTAVPPPGWPQVSNPAAQIGGGEVINIP